AVKLPGVPTPASPGTQITQTGVTGGIVVVAGDGRVGGLTGPVQATMPVQIPPATADSNGHFAFTGLETGMYSLRAVADGYAQQDINTLPGVQNGMTAQVNLTAGQAAKDVVLRLTPGGTVSGRVTGGNGEPLVNMEVSVLRPMYNPDGRK